MLRLRQGRTVAMVSIATFFALGLTAHSAASRDQRPGVSKASVAVSDERSAASQSFGLRLANAALERRWVPVIYTPAYVKIAYPGGDVPWYTGVCTDLVIRAYRTLGIDLQVGVHEARVGSGDTNIDHRRVNVLRKYFSLKGRSLPVSSDPERYQPGDIVTMYLPEGTSSKTHIAIVTQHKSATGVPLIVHNRGYGIQLEDWLFARKITGHYRYGG